MSQNITIIVNQNAFQSIVPSVLLDDDHVAIGHVRSRHTTIGEELIIDHWEHSDDKARGADLPAHFDYAMLVKSRAPLNAIRQLEQTLAPRWSQRVICIAIDEADHGMILVKVWTHAGVVTPVDVRFIGPKLTRLPGPLVTSKCDDRATRTEGALGPLYKIVQHLNVVLIAAGRGASELARHLVAIGVRRLTIIDHDLLGPENLDAMLHARPSEVGQSKALLLAKSLRANQPDLSVSCLTDSVTEHAALRFLDRTRADTVFSFVDNQAARLATGWKCQQGEMLHVDVGTLIQRSDQRTMQADIRLLEPGNGCVACVPHMETVDDALYALSAPEGAMQRGRPVRWDEQRAGSLLHLNSIASSLAVELWLGYLEGTVTTSTWTRLFWGSGEIPEMMSTPVAGDHSCRFCSRQFPRMFA